MDFGYLITRMLQNTRAIQALVDHVTEDQLCWSPSEDAWSILEVVEHLTFETDPTFRDRLDLVLNRPDESWVEGDAVRELAGRGDHRHLAQLLEAFLSVREESLAWL